MKKILFGLASLGIFLVTGHPTQAISYTERTVVPCRAANPSCWPDAFTFAPNGTIYYVERFTGQIRYYNPDTQVDKRFVTIRHLTTEGEQGLLGIALHPDWPNKKWIYVYYTHDDPLRNQVVRIKKKSDGTFVREHLFSTPAGTHHLGGVIHFGPDGKLYVVTGENYDPTLAQDLTSKGGKILRVNPNGSVPDDNPFDSFVFSFGHRNSYGFTFDPFDTDSSTVEVWQTENGPECNDEINFVQAGNNYGWGVDQACPNTNNTGENPVRPVYKWSDTIAVTGAVFCQTCDLGTAVRQQLVVGAYNTGTLLLATLNAARNDITEVNDLYSHGSGGYETGILGVEAGPHGRIYFSDSSGIYRLRRE